MPEPEHRKRSRNLCLRLRGYGTLLISGLLIFALPMLLAWWLIGGRFGWIHLLVGIGAGLLILLAAGLAFGWAIGRYEK
jgi:hypothetical protein